MGAPVDDDARRGWGTHQRGATKRYRGINNLVLAVTQGDEGYDSPLWATYKQWASLDAQVQKGEHATMGIKWGFTYSCEKCDHRGPAPCDKHRNQEDWSRFGWASPFLVFNAGQTDYEYEGYEPGELSDDARRADVDAWIDSLGADITHKRSNRAYYTPSKDAITLPNFDQFDTIEGYYGTKLHELTHWTGHESRLDRDSGQHFGDGAYASEELVAELGSAFASAHLGIATEPHINHAAYLGSWLSTLRTEPKVLYTSARDAQAALDFLITKAEGKEEDESNAA